jgi:hypothetical protein
MAGKATAAAGGGSEGANVGVVTDARNGSNTDSATRSQPPSDPNAIGVHGMHDLSLEDGSLYSTGKQVKLGGGDRMIVHVDIFQ